MMFTSSLQASYVVNTKFAFMNIKISKFIQQLKSPFGKVGSGNKSGFQFLSYG